MGETTDQLRQEVDGKREDAAQKIDQIEQRVTETVHRVQEGVTGTTDQVKATVQESIQGVQEAVGQTAQQMTDQVKNTAQQVTQQVKSTVDWRRQVEERPLVMVGAAFLGAFVLGNLTGGDGGGGGGGGAAGGGHAPDMPARSYGGPLYGSQGSHGHGAAGIQGSRPAAYGVRGQSAGSWGEQAGGGGLMGSLRGVVENAGLQDTLTNAASALLGSFGERIRSTLEEQIPGFAEQMRQRSEQGGQQGQGGDASQSGASGQSSWTGASGQSSQSFGAGSAGDQFGTTGQDAATSDATGRTTTYFGAEGGKGGSTHSPTMSG